MGNIVPWWAKHYPQIVRAYLKHGEDGLAEIEDHLRATAAKRPEGKFGKREVAYVPYVPIIGFDWRHKCEYCRFWVDSAPGKPGECMIVGRENDPFGGKAIYEKAACALYTPPAGEAPFDWISEQVSPTGADLVRGEYHERSEDDGGRPRAEFRDGHPSTRDQAIPTGATVGTELVADGLSAPVELVVDPGDPDRRLIADQTGEVSLHDGDGLRTEPFLDLGDRIVELESQYDERGLLGLALHPEFADNGRVFVRYSAPNRTGTPDDYDHTEVLSEFEVADDGGRADPDSERTIMEIPSPQFNHNAGAIEFGPDDGYLYVAMGDGGNECDTGPGHVEGGNGQNITENLLGGVLRIDVDTEGEADTPYAIPDDNPLVGEEGRDEYYAWGFRNPWGMSFDDEGRLFAADVGQHRFEEVNIVEKGGNYGWNVREGTHCFDPENPTSPPEHCPDENDRGEPLLDPIIEYRHVGEQAAIGSAVVGGNVYEGEAIPDLKGAYVFGDWAASQDKPSGRLFSATPPENGTGERRWSMAELVVAGRENRRLNRYVRSFARDPDGELYVLTSETHVPKGETGAVHRLVPPDR